MTASLRSPLERLHEAMRLAGERAAGALELRELPLLAQVTVRAEADVRTRISAALGVELPAAPNRWADGEPQAYWLGPDEWLLVGASGTEAALERAARAAAAPGWAAVVDVSDQRTVLELSGPAARDALAGGCALDLHPRAFGPGACAQTLLARAPVLIARGERPDAFRLLVRSSFAAYAAAWLLDASAAAA